MSVGGLEITDIKITPVPKKAGVVLEALARIELNKNLRIEGIRIVMGKFGPFVSFPRTFKLGEGYNISYPVTKEFQDYVSERILTAWRAVAPQGAPNGQQ